MQAVLIVGKFVNRRSLLAAVHRDSAYRAIPPGDRWRQYNRTFYICRCLYGGCGVGFARGPFAFARFIGGQVPGRRDVFRLIRSSVLAIGCEAALAVGFMTAQRNVGLMLAAAGGSLSDVTWLYFALSQLPVYLSPHLLVPLIERLRGLRAKS